MPLIPISRLSQNAFRKNDGTVLHGERDMYNRIIKDCEASALTWYMFYDLSLSFNDESNCDVQIDFLLFCNKGVMVVEVKGGIISVEDGKYFYEHNGIKTPMDITPFKQADKYKWALINHHIVNKNEIYIDSMCAFPHTHMDYTYEEECIDQRFKLWTADEHNDQTISFADYCADILERNNKRLRFPIGDIEDSKLACLVNRLAPTIINSRNYSETTVDEILNWLNISNLDALESLSKNDRIFIEGGPGTGKTTIAKGFMKLYSQQRGLYLCWNKLLMAKVQGILKEENITSCDVLQYGSFLMSISNNEISYSDIENSSEHLSSRVSTFFEKNKDNPEIHKYGYVIVDEVHDILDKGIVDVLDYITTIDTDGLKKGRFLAFFDNEQGYDSESRNLENYADNLAKYAAKYKLLENKRVQTNQEIVRIAEQVKIATSFKELNQLFESIESKNDYPIRIKHFASSTELLRYIKDFSDNISIEKKSSRYTLLLHSSMKYLPGIGKKDIFQVISEMKHISELTVNNVNSDWREYLQFTTILAYKGLENHHIILILKKEDAMKCFELYIGMSRAIVSLDLLIID